MSDVSLLSGISGLSFDSTLLSLVLLPSPVTFSAYWPIPKNFFQKILQYFLLGDQLFCMASVQQLGGVSWLVVCAACCHMTLVFAVMHLYNFFIFFLLLLSIPFFFYTLLKNLVSINQRNGPQYQCVLALRAF